MQHNKLANKHICGPWQRRFHEGALIVLSMFTAAIALKWAWPRIQALVPNLPEMWFIDMFAVVMAFGLLMSAVSVAWRAAEAWQSRDRGEAS